MAYTDTATLPEPTAEAVQALPGLVLLEFGTDWCPHCLGAQDAIRKVLAPRDDIQHIKVEDGPGRRLGRLFRVKLWPTLVLLQNGQEIRRTVRPQGAQAEAAVRMVVEAA
ncbi:thioredoxin family protein [Comamonas terrigena]|uniref:thioredoxin family protein n=1 Tax=Comamonas terrigena TaxID=32013 RepID=UPI00244B3EAE|nr:thioredoxin family protein [Comamonas terrigena]MDH1703375.1 thioredoxin family protein [Comamonas terrigena]